VFNGAQAVGREYVPSSQEAEKTRVPPVTINQGLPLAEGAEKPNETITELDSEKLRIETSNIGSGIKKILIKEYNATLPLEDSITISGYENLPFVLTNSEGGEITYQYENEEIKIVKKYSIAENDYLIEAGISIQNKADMSKLVSPKVISYLIQMSNLKADKKASESGNERDKSLNEYVVNSEKGMFRKAGAFKFSPKEAKEEFAKVFWSGFRTRYFCAIIKPQYETRKYSILPIDDKSLKIETEAQEDTILPQGIAHFNSTIYVGPEKSEILQTYRQGFEKIKRYYRLALFDGIAMIIDSLMRLIHRAVPSWGICIILISTIIYFSMYPLTLRSMVSMKKMQEIQPMIAKLKEKHKDNPEKMNKEMMGLYKEYKVNPFGGCLPMLLQMPVFIGLYQVLWRSVSFKGAKFLWIKDLSEPDRLFTFPITLPIIGNEFNILPILMIFIMFFQQKLSAKNMVIADPSQAAQQKMMTTIMPVFLGFIFYKFASGLTLYFTMFYMFSVFTQWKMSKQKKSA
jgi:YidC/Oxa1 family membrane protein insertase